jgi:Flp pilus assembly protein TadD
VALLAAAASVDRSAAILSDLGSALIAAGLPVEAEQRLREALVVQPAFFHALFNLGGLLLSQGRSAEAEPLLRHAHAVTPDDEQTRQALTSVLIAQGNAAYANGLMEQAESRYREATVLQPDLEAGFLNLGNALTAQLRLTEGLDAYRTAHSLDPANDELAFALALALLLAGDRDEGLRLHERRRGVAYLRPNYQRRPDLPEWQPGDSLAGKRVLVTAEQGAGDLIQHARFVPALAEIAASVVLEMPWPLTGLFHDLPGVGRVITLTDQDHGCDVACPLLSLPLILGPDAGLKPAYITPLPDRQLRWAAWLDRGPPGRRIGLVCGGDPRHLRDRDRSFPLGMLAPLMDIADATFVLVQTEIRCQDRDTFDGMANLRAPEAALTDYADTAALLSCLDLLISVDTSVAHLAGAMGQPVWTLLPYCPDYRWMLGRDDTPWYPSMRLFRQDRPGDWETVLKRVRDDLIE